MPFSLPRDARRHVLRLALPALLTPMLLASPVAAQDRHWPHGRGGAAHSRNVSALQAQPGGGSQGQPDGNHGEPQGGAHGQPQGDPHTGGQPYGNPHHGGEPYHPGQPASWHPGNPNWWHGNPGFVGYAGPRAGYYYAPSYGYYAVPRAFAARAWVVGAVVPAPFRSYVVVEPGFYGLPPAIRGYRWIYVNNTIALIRSSSGVVMRTVPRIW